MTAHRLVSVLLGVSLMAQEPFAFLPNHGQWPAQVHAGVRHGAMTTWLTDTGWTTRVGVLDREPSPRGEDGTQPIPMAQCAVVSVELVGGTGRDDTLGPALPGTVGFWLGDDPRAFAPAVPRHDGAVRREAWPGIDLVWGTRDRQIAYDLHIAPGAPLATARFRVHGHERSSVDDAGALVLDVGFGAFRHEPPRAWELREDGVERVLPVRFVLLDESTFAFAVDGRDAACALVIDPLVTWVSRSGGSNHDWPGLRQAIDRDPATGRVAVCGTTLSMNFPVTNGSMLVGLQDGCVTVRSATGALLFASYLGGSGNDAVQAVRWSGGSLVFGGQTASWNHPTTAGCLQPFFGGNYDMTVGRWDPLPNGQFVLGYCTYFGTSAIENVNAVQPLSGGRIAVLARAVNSSLPASPGSAQPQPAGLADGYLALLDPGQTGSAQWVAGTWIGGIADDIAQCLVLDSSGNFVVGGYTHSTVGFPITANAVQTVNQGSADGFVAQLDPTLSTFLYATYLGGPGFDEADDIAIDTFGRLAIGSWVGGSGFSFPLPNGPFNSPFGGGADGYALLLDMTLPPVQQVVWGTYIGGSMYDGVNGIAVDSSNRIVVTGPTQFDPVVTGFPTTPWTLPWVGGPGGPLGGQWDSFVARFDPWWVGSANEDVQFAFCSTFGGNSYEYAYDVVLDARGRAITTGLTSSTVLYGVGSQGGEDIFVATFDLLATVADRQGAPSPACANVVLDAYHRASPTGFDLILTASNAPTTGFGLVLVGMPDPIGTSVFGVTAHLDLLLPIASVAVLNPQPYGYAMLQVTANVMPPTGIGVQTLWLGGCAPFVASDMLRL
jgi:hypothetical protein